jgi:hypothetical protein
VLLTLRMTVLIPCLLMVPLAAQDATNAKQAPLAVQQAPTDPLTPAARQLRPQAGYPDQEQPTPQSDATDQADTDAPALQPPAQQAAQQATQPPAQPPTTPPSQPPPTQPPGGVEATPPVPKPSVQLPVPKPPPPVTTERDTGGDNFSIEPFYWLARSAPTVAQGHANTDFDPGALGFPGHSKAAEGIFITVPTGHENSFEFRAFQAKGQGNTVLGTTEQFFTTQYAIGDVLATNYRISSYKLSWNYLTYPYPSAGAKFRFKTLYEFQYAAVRGSFDAPADVNAVPTQGIKSIIRPTLGAGIEYHLARRVRFEAKLSGMGFPHHGDIYDGEASLAAGGPHFELLAGARIFHLKTSPTSDQYYKETLWGPYVGLRLIWK